jgi:signal transduction histidine kinase/CheY-like chemotaxis protein
MLEKYKKEHVNQNLQFILLDENGVVIESDNVLFDLARGTSLYEIHPFFESFPSLKRLKKELDFHCVNLKFDNIDLIVDMKVKKSTDAVVVSIYDFTEHYNSYQLVAQSRNESIIKNELTVIKNRELEERERFKNQFIQNFSHELRNPITSVMAISDILHETDLSSDQIKMLDFLKASTNNLRLLLEDTLSIGLIDSGKMEIQSKLFGLKELFDLLLFTYRSKAKKKGLSFDFFWDDKIPDYVEGDRLRLYQVLGNLLDNALKYTEAGNINLEMSLNQKWANKASIRIKVTDTGVGIAPKDLMLIFDSFQRIETNEKIKGTGLGLTIVKRLLTLMGSEIKVDSEENKGSNFYFDIILKYPVVESKRRGTNKKTIGKVKHQNSKQNKYKLLLVEDDEDVQLSLFKMLLNTKQFHIDLAYDGNLVLQEVVNNNYDVILMDVNLPNINGDQITRLIRDFPFKNVKNIPIIGITANAFEENIKEYIEAGMNSVLVKPFEKESFLDAIYKVLK